MGSSKSREIGAQVECRKGKGDVGSNCGGKERPAGHLGSVLGCLAGRAQELGLLFGVKRMRFGALSMGGRCQRAVED